MKRNLARGEYSCSQDAHVLLLVLSQMIRLLFVLLVFGAIPLNRSGGDVVANRWKI